MAFVGALHLETIRTVTGVTVADLPGLSRQLFLHNNRLPVALGRIIAGAVVVGIECEFRYRCDYKVCAVRERLHV